MYTFLKANISALFASVIDYTVTIGAVYFFRADAVLATTAGVITGGVINFLAGRYWAFNARHTNTFQQARRYGAVWLGNLLLNAGSMYFFTTYMLLHYAWVKVFTALAIAWGYNYPLQKHYVFRKNQVSNGSV